MGGAMGFWQVVGAVIVAEAIYGFLNGLLGAIYSDILEAVRAWRR